MYFWLFILHQLCLLTSHAAHSSFWYVQLLLSPVPSILCPNGHTLSACDGNPASAASTLNLKFQLSSNAFFSYFLGYTCDRCHTSISDKSTEVLRCYSCEPPYYVCTPCALKTNANASISALSMTVSLPISNIPSKSTLLCVGMNRIPLALPLTEAVVLFFFVKPLIVFWFY